MTHDRKTHSEEIKVQPVDEHGEVPERTRSRKLILYTALILGGLSAPALPALWSGHKAHILQFLPYGIFLLCPIMHLFMHGKHGKGH